MKTICYCDIGAQRISSKIRHIVLLNIALRPEYASFFYKIEYICAKTYSPTLVSKVSGPWTICQFFIV